METNQAIDLEKSLEVALEVRGLTLNQFCKQSNSLKANVQDICRNRLRSIGALNNLSERLGYPLWKFIKLGSNQQ